MKRNLDGQSLDRTYRLVLAVAAGLLLGDQLLVQPDLARLTIDSPWAHVEERQRTLSQRLAKAVLLLDRGTDAEHAPALEETKRVLGTWESAQRRLSEAPRSDKALKAAVEAVRPHFEAIRAAARNLIAMHEAGTAGPARRRELDVLLSHEPDYLRRMDGLVGLRERATRKHIATIRWVGWALTGLTLATLVAWGRFVRRPNADAIRRRIADLDRTVVELQDHLRERTQELRDVGRKHLDVVAQLGHLGRTNAIEGMALSLAHELNQPLGAIANYAEGCLNALKAPNPSLDEVRAALQRLLTATMRAGRIIDQVRNFVSGEPHPAELVHPNRIVADALDLLEAEVKWTGTTVRVDLAPDLPEVWGDPTQLQQVLINLIQNASQALARAQLSVPTLVVSTRRCDQDHIEFAVTDNGPGIEEDQLHRVFDPHFSTRANGMGVGLAICRTIADAHHGRLTVESEPGIRTIFRFQIPIHRLDHE